MGFLKIDTTSEAVKDYNGEGNSSKWLVQSGMYDVIIKAAIVNVSTNGSKYIDLLVEHEGQSQMIYQAMRITNKNGEDNDIGIGLITKLCTIGGAEGTIELAEPTPVTLPIGKGGELKECMVLSEFTNIPVTIRLQMDYGIYNEQIQQNKNIKNFFRFVDKATAAEIVNGVTEFKQYAIELEHADKDHYRDNLTKEDIDEWKKLSRTNKEAEKDKTPSAGFGQKRTFGKKE